MHKKSIVGILFIVFTSPGVEGGNGGKDYSVSRYSVLVRCKR